MTCQKRRPRRSNRWELEAQVAGRERPHKLSRFVAAGIVQPDRDGRFPIEPSLASYWRYWRDVIARANQLRRWRVSGETLAGQAHRRSLEAR